MAAEGNDLLGNLIESCRINEENSPAKVESIEFSKPTQLKKQKRYVEILNI